MKSLRKVLSCALALTIVAGMFAMPAAAVETEEQAAVVESVEAPETDAAEHTEGNFTIDDNGVLTKYSGKESSVTIPSSIAGITVKTIGKQAFRNNSSIYQVKIPDTVSEIQGGDINHGAFSNCSNLTAINIPDSVTNIGNNAFSYCKNLAVVNFGKNVKTIGKSAFKNCEAVVSITIPDSVTEIGECAFSCCRKMKNLTISNNLKTIEDGTFEYCSDLSSLVIPNSVVTIGEEAFQNSGTKTLKLGKNVETIGKEAFTYNKNLTTIEFNDKLKTIGNRAFASSSALKSIVIPDSVTMIGEDYFGTHLSSAFEFCSSLESVTLGKGITSIGYNTFYSCSSLKEIVIPSNVKAIEQGAFDNCYKLEKITLNEGLERIGQMAFSSTAITSITFPDSVMKIDYAVLSECHSLSEVKFGSGLTKLDKVAFELRSLKTIYLDKNLVSVDDGAFNTSKYISDIYYTGTKSQWNNLASDNSDAYLFKLETYRVHCTDGIIPAKNAKTVVSIKLHAPSKKEYEIGEELDITGGQLLLTYSDKDTEYIPLTREMCSGFDSKTAGQKVVTVTYEGFTDSFTVTVKGAPEKTVKSISVIPPTKTQYVIGEALDVTGGFVTIQYSDNSSESIPLEASMCSGFSSKTAGDKTVTVKYGGKTATFKVTVNKQSEDPSKSGVKLNGEAVASYEAAIKSIGNKTGEFTLTINAPITVSKFTFPKNAKLEIIATENGSITTTAASLAPSAPLVIECPITNSKGKAVAINAKSDLTVTGGSFGNITVKGKAELTNVIVNGSVKLAAKADKFGLTTDTLTNVTATKGVSSNNNVEFADCPSLGTINVKGTVKITGAATRAVALTASSKTGISEVENLTVDKKVSIAGNLIASGLTSAGAVDVKGTATIADSTIAGKLSTKGALNVNGEVYCANAISCAQLTSNETAHLTYQSLAVTKYGIAANSADITVKVIDKRGSTVRFVAGDKKAVVVKSLKLPKGGTYNAVLILDEDCGTGTLTFEKNKVVLK